LIESAELFPKPVCATVNSFTEPEIFEALHKDLKFPPILSQAISGPSKFVNASNGILNTAYT
jgi:hypothetical protein